MKKLLWLILTLAAVMPSLFLVRNVLSADPVQLPINPDSIVRTERYAQFAFFLNEGGIMRIEPDGRVTAEKGGHNCLSVVHVEKMYVVSEHRGFIILEGIYRNAEWSVLTALDITGHIDFCRFITADSYNLTYVPNSPYVGDFYFTNSQGKKLMVNIRGDLFGPVQEVK